MRLLSLARLPADAGLSVAKRLASGALGVVRGAGTAAPPSAPRPRHPDPSPPLVVPPEVLRAQEAPRRRAREEAEASRRVRDQAVARRARAEAAGAAREEARGSNSDGEHTGVAAPPLPDEAKTIDDEPVPVAEVADPGAEEGAGLEIHVPEPWDGYDGMNVQEIRSRLGRVTGAELATVQLYEAAGKNRRSVLAAVSARLNAPPSG